MPLIIERNDITKMRVDAIVNAANSTLLGGGGVDGAIHRAAGRGLLEECRLLGGCNTGEAKATKGYDLPAKYVIHTVGPIWRGGKRNEEALLRSCYSNSLRIASELSCESVAFPLISSGVYGYPKREAAAVACSEIEKFLDTNDMTVYVVIFDRPEDYFSPVPEIKDYLKKTLAEEEDYRRLEKERRASLFRRRPEALAERLPEADRLSSMPSQSAQGMLGAVPMSAAREKNVGSVLCDACRSASLEDELSSLDEGFSRNLLRRIDMSGMTDAECYRRANIDRKLFSKIRSDPNYRPSKPTVIAFAVALRLDLDNTSDLLRRAGFALSRSSKFDVIVEYFIRNRIYDVYRINETLFTYDQSLLGS